MANKSSVVVKRDLFTSIWRGIWVVLAGGGVGLISLILG
jgi:hypothetical protein